MASQNSEEIYNGRMKFHNQEYHLFNLVHVGMLNSIVTCTGRFLWPVLQYSGHICSAPWNKCLRWFLLLSKQGSPINIQVVAEPNWNTTDLKREMWRTEKKCARINYYIRQLLRPVLEYSGYICSAPYNKCLTRLLLLSKQGSPTNIQFVAEPNRNTLKPNIMYPTIYLLVCLIPFMVAASQVERQESVFILKCVQFHYSPVELKSCLFSELTTRPRRHFPMKQH